MRGLFRIRFTHRPDEEGLCVLDGNKYFDCHIWLGKDGCYRQYRWEYYTNVVVWTDMPREELEKMIVEPVTDTERWLFEEFLKMKNIDLSVYDTVRRSK